MEAIILAGGLGTRLGELTSHTPKPMLQVNGRPFVSYVMDYLIESEVNCIVFAVSYLSNQFIDFFGESYKGVPIRFSIEKEPLGTGGAIKNAAEMCQGNTVLVVNGDTFCFLDIRKMHEEHQQKHTAISIGISRVDDTYRYGSVISDQNGFVASFTEKGSASGPGHINCGTYLINKDVLKFGNFPACFSFEKDILEGREGLQLKINTFPTSADFLDIGVPSDFERSKSFLKARAI